ncbi:hypothetical protein [Sphingobium sp. B11D3A]|uniref:hypothetical protein n=1 Tax=Sphingobium sp. B11D3A TaxID=2940574 RepID=UPI00222432C6|nr:hypothetical protein [Sphingobium sp. B11D3A]MCW2391943.1 hypothetical protein [Sphingobium sp. B11D3A]
MALTIIVTDAGRAALVNAANNGTNPVVIAQAGITATAVVPSASATAIPGEIKRISTISGDVVADDMIHLVVRDETADSYALRSFGLYLADGTLFAIYGQAEPLVEKSSQAMMLLAIDIAFADIDAAEISFGDANFINPPATETVQGVVELATPAETAAGVDTSRAVHPKGLKDSVTSWLNARFGEGNPSAFMKGLLATASAAAMRVALGIKSGALKDEGAGGGLDADLLDGQHGSYYSNVLARLGFTPVNKAGDTMTGPLAINATSAPFVARNSASATGHADMAGFSQANGGGALTEFAVLQLGVNNVGIEVRNQSNTKGVLCLQPYGGGVAIGNAANTAWHAGNDGAGSGLDADTVDGFHASKFMQRYTGDWLTSEDNLPRFYFAPASATYLRVNSKVIFQNTLSNDVGWINEAGGMEMRGGIVARSGSSYAMLGSDGDCYLRRADNSQGALYLGSAYLYYDGGNFHFGSGGHVYINNGYVWTATSDGAGSGMDADMLDGLHADAFDRFVDANLSATNGYVVHANGLKECWTMLWVPADSAATWALPVAHSSWVNPVIAMSINNGENNAQQTVGIVSATTSHVTIYSAVNYGQYVRIQTKGV